MKALHDLRAPGEADAERRAWKVAAAALPAGEQPARRRRGPLVAVAATLALLAAAVTPPGSAVADWLGDAVRSVVTDDPPPRSADGLDDLPGGGRVLVLADGSVRIGRHTLLAGADRATWSPHGRFVAAARGNELLAVDRQGDVRWSLPAPANVEHVAWSPDGFRVAYATATQMRLVAGDGTGDRVVTQRVVRDGAPAFGAPAWRPNVKEHVLAYSDRRRVWVVNTDRRRVLWSARAKRAGVEFSPDGTKLLVAGARGVRILGARSGRTLGRLRGTFGGAAWTRDGRRLVLTRRTGARTAVLLADPEGRTRRLFAAGSLRLGGLSPDGRWLLVDWTETSTWLFLPLDGGRVRQLTGVPRRFGARAVTPMGWCCPPE